MVVECVVVYIGPKSSTSVQLIWDLVTVKAFAFLLTSFSYSPNHSVTPGTQKHPHLICFFTLLFRFFLLICSLSVHVLKYIDISIFWQWNKITKLIVCSHITLLNCPLNASYKYLHVPFSLIQIKLKMLKWNDTIWKNEKTFKHFLVYAF